MIKLTNPISYHCTKAANFSVWNFDPIWLNAGEQAKVIKVLAESATNPLYLVQRSDGETKAIYRRDLLEHGEFS